MKKNGVKRNRGSPKRKGPHDEMAWKTVRLCLVCGLILTGGVILAGGAPFGDAFERVWGIFTPIVMFVLGRHSGRAI